MSLPRSGGGAGGVPPRAHEKALLLTGLVSYCMTQSSHAFCGSWDGGGRLLLFSGEHFAFHSKVSWAWMIFNTFSDNIFNSNELKSLRLTYRLQCMMVSLYSFSGPLVSCRLNV